jgi:hypothetical protein
MQGPIVKFHNFTLKVAIYYKSAFPKCEVIVSTWENELKKSEIKKLSKAGVYVITNGYPEYEGNSHLNYQIKSSAAGIELAEQLGVSRLIKTRTDQGLLNPKIFKHLEEVFSEGTQPVILVSTFNSFHNSMYQVSDMLQYSTLDILKNYWNHMPLQKRGDKFIPEEYLIRNYLLNLGLNPENYTAVVQTFRYIDGNILDQVWYRRGIRDIKTFPSNHPRDSRIV